jgi:REP element-mobilizing transposase RayT
MNEAGCYVDTTERNIIEDQVAETCLHRGWQLHAVNSRSNHVHAVVTANGVTPKKVLDDLKAWCTRRLKRNIRSSKNELVDRGWQQATVIHRAKSG